MCRRLLDTPNSLLPTTSSSGAKSPMSGPVTYQGHDLSSPSGITSVTVFELREITVLVFRIAGLRALLDDDLDGPALVFVEQVVHRAHRGRADSGSAARASALHEEQDHATDDHDPD